MGDGVVQRATPEKLFTQAQFDAAVNSAHNAGYVNGARESNQPSAFVNQAQNTSKGLLSKLGVSKTVTAVLLGASVAILAASVFSGGTALVLAAAAGFAFYHLADRGESSPPPIYHSTPPNSLPGHGSRDGQITPTNATRNPVGAATGQGTGGGRSPGAVRYPAVGATNNTNGAIVRKNGDTNSNDVTKNDVKSVNPLDEIIANANDRSQETTPQGASDDEKTHNDSGLGDLKGPLEEGQTANPNTWGPESDPPHSGSKVSDGALSTQKNEDEESKESDSEVGSVCSGLIEGNKREQNLEGFNVTAGEENRINDQHMANGETNTRDTPSERPLQSVREKFSFNRAS